MKKISLIVIISSLCMILASCDSTYNEKHIALYDSHTKQYIHLGDTREQIISILGEPDFPSSQTMSYENYGLLVSVRNDNTADYFELSGNPNDASTSERLKIARRLTVKSSVEEFMKSYPDAVDQVAIPPESVNKGICFLKNNDNYDVVSGDTIADIYVSFAVGENNNRIILFDASL